MHVWNIFFLPSLKFSFNLNVASLNWYHLGSFTFMLLFSNSHDVLFASQMGKVCACRMAVHFCPRGTKTRAYWNHAVTGLNVKAWSKNKRVNRIVIWIKKKREKGVGGRHGHDRHQNTVILSGNPVSLHLTYILIVSSLLSCLHRWNGSALHVASCFSSLPPEGEATPCYSWTSLFQQHLDGADRDKEH